MCQWYLDISKTLCRTITSVTRGITTWSLILMAGFSVYISSQWPSVSLLRSAENPEQDRCKQLSFNRLRQSLVAQICIQQVYALRESA